MSEGMTRGVKQQVIKLGLVAVGMFAFVFVVMVPLYDLFCEVTGLNGKTGGPYQAEQIVIDESRSIKVQMMASNTDGMIWDFGPNEFEVSVHPGESIRVSYTATNPTNRAMTAQAIPSVLPFRAASYFHKTECFCFNQQVLAPGETVEMPIVFIVDPALPENVSTITLSYMLFDVTPELEVAEAN